MLLEPVRIQLSWIIRWPFIYCARSLHQADPRAAGDRVSAQRSAPGPASSSKPPITTSLHQPPPHPTPPLLRQLSINTSTFDPVFSLSLRPLPLYMCSHVKSLLCLRLTGRVERLGNRATRHQHCGFFLLIDLSDDSFFFFHTTV